MNTLSTRIKVGLGALVLFGLAAGVGAWAQDGQLFSGQPATGEHCPCTPDCQPGDPWCTCPDECTK